MFDGDERVEARQIFGIMRSSSPSEADANRVLRYLSTASFYDRLNDTDLCHAAFTLTEQKKAREYTATVYEGNTSTGVELTFRIERGTKINNQFI